MNNPCTRPMQQARMEKIVEQYRQDAVGQITRIGELLGEAATGTIDDRTLAGLGMACELGAEKVMLYQQTAGMAAKIAHREQ